MTACKRIREAVQDIGNLYYEDWSGCVLASEPEPWYDEESEEWVEPDLYDITCFEYRDIMRAVFGSLASDIR